jgi:opacity protein-like surface antigen
MRRHWFVILAIYFGSTVAFGQSFEAAISGGEARFPSSAANLGTASTDPNSGNYVMKDGFRLTFRMAINSWRFFGHEIGYAYNRTSIDVPSTSSTTVSLPGQPGSTTTVPASSLSVPIHQGFYDFLAYATPEGSRIRPFACGGVQFSSFFPPGTSAYYGNQVTKFGINYGGGLKAKVSGPWGIRFDARQYNTGKPFSFPNQSGRLLMWEFSAGLSFNL